MRRLSVLALSLVVVFVLAAEVHAVDGTEEGACPSSGSGQSDAGAVHVTEGTYVASPFESVSMNETIVWPDNRLRAYWSSSLLNVDGFLLFDVSGIPDTETVVSLTLRCYLENSYGSPYSGPVVDVYYSGDDGWGRDTVPAGQLSLDVLLASDILFSSYMPYYDFVLDVDAHDWSVDLLDNEICIGLRNGVSYYSYVYFFGAYGEPIGLPPELTIETSTSSPVTESSWAGIKVQYQ